MTSLISWLVLSIQKPEIHALVTIAIFVVSFLAIHPFQDGNGRLSRVLTSLLLLRAGYDYIPYSSLEKIIEENKDFYYAKLRKAQVESKKSSEGLESWIVFFLECLVKQKNALRHRIENEKIIGDLSKVSKQILVLLREHEMLSVGEISRLLGTSRNTIKSHVFSLVNHQQIKKHGTGRGTYYTLNS